MFDKRPLFSSSRPASQSTYTSVANVWRHLWRLDVRQCVKCASQSIKHILMRSSRNWIKRVFVVRIIMNTQLRQTVKVCRLLGVRLFCTRVVHLVRQVTSAAGPGESEKLFALARIAQDKAATIEPFNVRTNMQ